MNDPELHDLRRRIRELQAIPERDRTDEQWDELNELEIRTAPGNRESTRPRERQSERRSGHTKRSDRGQANRNNAANANNASTENRPSASAEGGEKTRRPPKRQHRRRRPVEVTGQS